MDLYREYLLDHYHSPRGWGLAAGAQAEARGVNPACGDEITLQLFVEQQRLRELRFEGHGCVISRAAASVLHEYSAGRECATLRQLSLKDMQELLHTSIPAGRLACVGLPLETLQRALASL